MPYHFLKEIFDRAKEEKFCIYLEELQKWNKKINLTSIKDNDEIIEKLFLDSVFFLKFFNIEPGSYCLDIGSGAGFPGIPIKIMSQEINLFLLEATKKKVSFLKHISRILSLEKIHIVNKRLEEISNDKNFFGKFELIITRAVSPSLKLITDSYKLLSKKGVLIYFGGENPKRNFIVEKNFFATSDLKTYQLPLSKLNRTLIIFRK